LRREEDLAKVPSKARETLYGLFRQNHSTGLAAVRTTIVSRRHSPLLIYAGRSVQQLAATQTVNRRRVLMARTIVYNLIQLLFVLGFAPLYSGVLSRFKETVQSKRGPSIFQPYRDLWKLFHKDEVVSSETTWIFRITPYLVFIVPLFVASLIPVLTAYPLAFAFMGDMLAGGFFLGLGGFFAALAAVDTGNPYGPMGASRTRMVGFLAEPVFMIVFFTVSFVAQSTIPYIVQQKWVANPAAFFPRRTFFC
jgi:formate hydrogenlyase subunit 4